MPHDGGMARAPLAEPALIALWHRFRLPAALLITVIGLVFGAWWSWTGGLVIASLALVAGIDAYHRRDRGAGGSPFPSLLLDLTLIGAGILLFEVETGGIAAPYIYMMAMPLLLLPLRKALPVMGYATLWAVAALTPVVIFPLPLSVNGGVVTTVAFAVFTAYLLILMAIVARSLELSREHTQQRLEREAVFAAAGRELLASRNEDALDQALEAIRIATGASVAFVAENRGDRDTGPAAVVKQVTAEPDPHTYSRSMTWTLPYMQHREVAELLANGKPVRLDAALATVAGSDPSSVFSVAVPVLVVGEWAGFLGVAFEFGDDEPPGIDLHILQTVAAMIGAFLERQQAYQRLEQLIRSKDDFLASVSHEVRTPLTSVLGFASLLNEDPDQLATAEGQELVGMIESQAQEVSDLVDDLLVAARAEIDAIKVTKEPVELASEISKVLAARLGLEGKDIFLSASPEHRVVADPIRVRQIIRNLVTNALKYGGDQITITTHRDGPEVTLVFTDNGDGIPPEHRRRIFDPYHRGRLGHSQPESIGLGLSVSRQLARLMDGDLTLRSDLGPAAFQLALPTVPKEESSITASTDADVLVTKRHS